MSLHQDIFPAPLTIGAMRLGAWGAQMNAKEMRSFVEGCLDLGCTTFDHADIYGSYTTEADFGMVLKTAPELREEMQIVTKCGIRAVSENRPDHKVKAYDSTPVHIIRSVENSLKALHTDYIDVLLLHRPDVLMDPEAVAKAFEQLRAAGKVKHFGVSNFTPSQVQLLQSVTPLVTHQIEASVLHRNAFQDGTLDQCLMDDLVPMIWSPLAGGRLVIDDEDADVLRVQEVANPMLERYDVAFDQLMLAWVVQHPAAMQLVLGTSKLERVKKALKALEVKISREDWYALWQAASGRKIP